METYFLKITGKVNIPSALEIGHNYHLTADCSIVSEQKSDNEDGTYSVTYKLIPITVEVGRNNGEVIKAKDPRRNSQKVRNYLWKAWQTECPTEDFDRLYDEFTNEVMLMTPELVRQALRRINGTR